MGENLMCISSLRPNEKGIRIYHRRNILAEEKGTFRNNWNIQNDLENVVNQPFMDKSKIRGRQMDNMNNKFFPWSRYNHFKTLHEQCNVFLAMPLLCNEYV